MDDDDDDDDDVAKTSWTDGVTTVAVRQGTRVDGSIKQIVYFTVSYDLLLNDTPQED